MGGMDGPLAVYAPSGKREDNVLKVTKATMKRGISVTLCHLKPQRGACRRGNRGGTSVPNGADLFLYRSSKVAWHVKSYCASGFVAA
jgi:hypothetical protein